MQTIMLCLKRNKHYVHLKCITYFNFTYKYRIFRFDRINFASFIRYLIIFKFPSIDCQKRSIFYEQEKRNCTVNKIYFYRKRLLSSLNLIYFCLFQKLLVIIRTRLNKLFQNNAKNCSYFSYIRLFFSFLCSDQTNTTFNQFLNAIGASLV